MVAYTPLPMSLLSASAVGFCAPAQTLPEQIDFDHPAVEAMTDLAKVSAVIIRPTDGIDEAHARMKQRGVRLLLVVDLNRMVVGLITATDVLGDKPVRYAEANGIRHDEILVRDIMRPAEALEVIAVADVESAKVGHVVATLKASGRQHALVIDGDGRIRGIFSATQIARLLGVEPEAVKPTEIATTFAEIEAMLAP